MTVGIILIVIALIILSPIFIIMIKGMYSFIYSAWRYDEVDEIYELAVVAGLFILAAGMACVFKYHKPEQQEQQKQQIQTKEITNERLHNIAYDE